jgi:hypothetical protein
MTEEQARRRFMILNLVRLSALGLVMAGATNIAGKMLPDLAPLLGAFLLIAGAADFFVLPVLLKKYWQNEDQ